MRLVSLILAAAISGALLSGCQLATSLHHPGLPFEESEIAGVAACEYIDGVWIGQEKSDEPVFLRYAGQGRIQAVAAQPSGREAPEQAVTVAILSIHEDALYLNWIVEEMQGIEPGYLSLIHI